MERKNRLLIFMIFNTVLSQTMKRAQFVLSLLVLFVLSAWSHNTEEVDQVTGVVTLNRPVDYVVTSETPFADRSVVDIVNTDDAVLILKRVKPSKALTMLSHVRIQGAAAINRSNCMVKIYANGTIILPYGSDIKPLTVYTGVDQTGDSESFSADYRVSLANKPMNNKIRSFILKRGYMATFATKADGKGYSRVFIADTEDRKVNLPPILDKAVSSIRVMPWNDVSKKGFAGRAAVENTVLNTTWCYNWDAGNDFYEDREFVTQRHHESGMKNGKYEGAWPSVYDCGNNGSSPHILGQNEPDNTGDPREVVTKVEDLLAIWPELMATGKRLGSPAMAGNLNMLYQFLDSIDARGWRCDFVAVHSYWYSDWGSWQWNFNNIHNRTGRPIWITEMNYGANWTGWPAGDDRSGSAANLEIQRRHMVPILDGLESMPFIERYAYYNAVQDCRSAYLNGALTPTGQYYADIQSNLAYNSANEYVPKLPKSKGAPSDLAVRYDASVGEATLTWYEPTGEYNKSMTVERYDPTTGWGVLAEIDLQEEGANYSYKDNTAQEGTRYRVRTVYADNQSYETKAVEAVREEVSVGDVVMVDGKTMYLGGNILPNGSFELGTKGWTDGEGKELAQPHFEVFPIGGYDGGSYLQAFSDAPANRAESVKTPVELVPNANYYLSSASQIAGVSYSFLYLSADGKEESKFGAGITSSTTWSKQASTFNSGEYTRGFLTFRRLGGRAKYDKISLSRLFDTRAEAVADGIKTERARAVFVADANTTLPSFNGYLSALAASAEDAASLGKLTSAINNTIMAMRLKSQADSCMAIADVMLPLKLDGAQDLEQAINDVRNASTAETYVASVRLLKNALDAYLPLVSTDKVAKPNFDGSSIGWNVKTGSYTGGVQNCTTEAGKTAWSALWTGLSASEGETKTMAINQSVSGLTHGYYVLRAKAATQHYGITDQHASIRTKTDSIVSPSLVADWLDIPEIADADKWQTLTTMPVYLTEDDTITIGFTGSKKNAVDNAWKECGNPGTSGDMREGSWWATDFELCRVPVYRASVDASGWGTICLPYDAKPTPGVKFYRIAGTNAEGSMVYIEEISQTAAGVPCIIHSETSTAIIQESGEEVSRASYGDNNLRGMFITAARAPKDCYTLENGVWVKQDSDDRNSRPNLHNFTGFINRMNRVEVLDSWSGLSMPTAIASGIRNVAAPKSTAVQYYTIDGRKVGDVRSPGIYIRVQDGKATKVVLGK